MPHASTGPYPGLQALILCGPGHSLDTFTSNPEEVPKALIPVANRPMVWYPLDWCYRAGISNIHLISPHSSFKALDAALSQNPHLTSLPLPRASVLAPSHITQTSGTADLLRAPEVQAVIKGDFIVLPCDLICDIPGDHFFETWMNQQPDLIHAYSLRRDSAIYKRDTNVQTSRHGGLGVWYEAGGDATIKNEETDFLITAPLSTSLMPSSLASLHGELAYLTYLTTAATLKDIAGNEGSFPVRHGLIRKHGRVKTRRTYRDSHMYVFPYWILDLLNRNVELDSIGEDLVGSWAKSRWQPGLCEKLGFENALRSMCDERLEPTAKVEVHIDRMTSTLAYQESIQRPSVQHQEYKSDIPPIVACTIGTSLGRPLIRRMDTPALVSHVSLELAKLDAIEDVGRTVASPFAHARKIANQASIATKSTVTKVDCLLADNVTVEEKVVIKESVIGVNSHIKSGARLVRCVLMDGVVVGEKCQLTGCIIGRRSQIGRECTLRDCEVQDVNQVPERTESKGEKFTVFEGLDGEFDLGEGGSGGPYD